ncbi:hypothetical protein CY35_17G047500 [Sphagnum magellanicum]|nr:hypothetical protein CY35_17G047500 [Sphagnum magellanicum]KAH9535353.1 hypothetical protein CY35_17G047500 [Sphagnum magellanicum]KAH9535354.1 hypothetical protein CY35_17G047500 [Sphagnum magellanicum]
MARHSFRKSPRAHGMKLYMFVQLIANLCITDWSSGLVCWESFIKLLCLHAYSLYATCRRGSLNFTVTEFDDYYVAFGNSNAHEMKISFCLKMHCMIYSVPDAESKCSLVNGNICGVPLSLSKSKRVLISAPDKKQHGADVSKV